MQTMTGHERIANILQRKPVDRIGLFEHFWDDTQRIWQANGWIPDRTPFEDVFQFDMQTFWSFNLMADLDFKEQIIEETAETVLKRDGNGALLRRHKLHDATPEHVDFLVKERDAWEEHIKPKLTADRRRIDFAGYRAARARAAEALERPWSYSSLR